MVDPRIKDAFSGVKNDIDVVNSRISRLESKIESLLKILEELASRNESKTPKSEEFGGFKPYTPKTDSSSGNEGVQSINQAAIKQQSINHQSIKQKTAQIEIKTLKDNLENNFRSLSKQQFLLFLTAYQMEDDLGRGPTYQELSSRIGLTEGCIRGYTTYIIGKGLPLVRKKLNNQITTLTIDPTFKELGLKQRLINIYYHQDPDQTKLFQK